MGFMVLEVLSFILLIKRYKVRLSLCILFKNSPVKELSSFHFLIVQLCFSYSGICLQVSVPNNSHLASTYCALAILKTVGYDLSLINSTSILKSMKCLQQSDGR